MRLDNTDAFLSTNYTFSGKLDNKKLIVKILPYLCFVIMS